jgi:hypothetical protein
MKTRELLNKFPMTFLVWNLNEDTGVFWTDLTTLEDNEFRDPWGQRISLREARRQRNRVNDVVAFHIDSEFQGHPIELIVMNE